MSRLTLRAQAPLLVLALCGTASLPAQALTDAELQQRLQTRFDGDRTGACVLAAVVSPTQVQRGRVCAAPRADGGPGFEQDFEIGSISKTMTAFLVADLVAAGRWTLDDPIAKHLPAGTSVPRQGQRQITVRDLVTHRAALPALPPGWVPKDPANPYASLTPAELLAALARTPLQGAIGQVASYSNFGMMVLSVAVARALAAEPGAAGDLEQALATRLFAPLGMAGAYIARPSAGAKPAAGHLPTGEVAPAWTWDSAPNAAGVGGVRARLDDLVRYAQAHLGLLDTPLAARLRSTQAEQAPGSGMNWMRASVQGHDLVLHEGGTGGFSALLALEPARQQAVVLLADTALADLGGLGPLGLSLLDPAAPLPKARRAVPVSPAMRAAVVGDYTLAGLAVKVWADGPRLLAQASGQGVMELRADDQGDLYPVGLSALLRPVLEGGRMTRFAWHQGGGMMEGVRVGSERPATASNPAWQAWAGVYRLAPQFALRVFEDAGKLMVQGTGQPAIEASVAGTDLLRIAAVGAELSFARNDKGEVTGLTLRQGGQVLPGKKE
jgi:D-alanyl-D-alanine-carboxypeptidase/D-alanyl-D-alanine-endopeptidase